MRRLLLSTLALLLCAAPAWAQTDPKTLIDLEPTDGLEAEYEVGFKVPNMLGATGRVARTGRWCPVVVSLSSSRALRGSLTLESFPIAPPDVSCIFDEAEVDLPAGGRQRFHLAFRTSKGKGIRIVLRDRQREVRLLKYVGYDWWFPNDKLLRLEPGAALLATLQTGTEPGSVFWPPSIARGASAGQDGTSFSYTWGHSTAVVLDEVPERRALHGLDAILIPSPPANLEPEQAADLTQYVEAGGVLIVGSGISGSEWARNPLADLLPVEVLGQENRRDALASIDSSLPPGELTRVAISRPRPGARVVHSAGDNAPLVTTQRRGKGHVAFLGFPLTHPGFKKSDVRARVLSESAPLPRNYEGARVGDPLESELAQFVGVRVMDEASVSWIAWLVLGFLAITGPLDYLIWRKFPRPEVTWALLILTSLGFSALAFVLGHTGGDEALRLGGVAVVDLPNGAQSETEQTVQVEGLLCMASTRLQNHVVTAPVGTRLGPSIESPGSLTTRGTIDSGPWATLGSAIAIRLGLANGVAFRTSGPVQLSPPFTARYDETGTLVVTSHTKRALPIHVLRHDAATEAFVLPPGEERSVTLKPMEGHPITDHGKTKAKNLRVLQDTLMPEAHWKEGLNADKLLLRAALNRAGARLSDREPFEVGRVDSTPDYDRGATIVLAADEGFPFEFQKDGKVVPLSLAHTLYRIVLEPRRP